MGEWPDYTVSTVRVLDGSDGSLLWSFDSPHSSMMSSVSVVSEIHGQDALFFLTIGMFEEDWGGVRKKRAHPLKRDIKGEDRLEFLFF